MKNWRGVLIFVRRIAVGIAQLVERLVRNEKARGSNPLTSKAAGVEVKSTSGLIIGSLGGA